MMGQLFASQVHHAIARDVYGGDPRTVIYVGNKAVGDFMRKRVFEPGRTVGWNELTQHATGERSDPQGVRRRLRKVQKSNLRAPSGGRVACLGALIYSLRVYVRIPGRGLSIFLQGAQNNDQSTST